jgi:hypothetical protein
LPDAATRHASAHFPFPPFTIHFNKPNLNISQIKSEFSTHATSADRLEMNIIDFRRSKASCSDNQFNLLICVNETEVFALLLSKSN